MSQGVLLLTKPNNTSTMTLKLFFIGLGLLASGSVFSQTATIQVDAATVKNRITPWLYGACIEDVNHEIYGGLYDQKIFGESFEEPAAHAKFEGFTIYGGVWLANGALLNALPSPGAQFVYERQPAEIDAVEVELKFNTTQGANAGLVVRLNNPGNGADNFDGYEISLATDGRRIIFGKHEHNWQPIRDVAVEVDPLAWNRLRVEMAGEELRIRLNGKEVFRHIDKGTVLRKGLVSFRNWDANVSFRNFILENPTPQTVAFVAVPRPCISWMWDAVRQGRAQAVYRHESNRAFNGKHAQSMEHKGGDGIVGISNSGLNHWGIAVHKGVEMQGSLWLKNTTAPLYVALQDATGTKEYATQKITVKKSEQWAKYSFTLLPNETDPTARFVLYLDRAGSCTADHVRLTNAPQMQFCGLPLRKDIGVAMVNQGLRFLRYGGTMVNASGYRFKNMIGDPAYRPPYTGHWYPYATNGFGIEEFVQFCEKAGFEASFAVNIEETPQDMADMVEYLNGAVETPWGQKRAENGHPAPYGVRYIEIGNEEVIGDDDAAGYNHYIERFLLLADAIHSKDPDIRLINAAWWRAASPSMERVFRALDGKAAYWDYHPWTDALHAAQHIDRDLMQMQSLFKQWNPQTTMKCAIFEENGVSHHLQRAIVHATVQNVVRRHGDFVLTTCAANALQPYMQNDNGWDQGQIFFTPDKVWGMPTFYAQQLSAANHAEQLVESHVTGVLDVTATLCDDNNTLIMHIINTSDKVVQTTLHLDRFVPTRKAVVYTLSGQLSDENLPVTPEKIMPDVHWIEQPGTTFDYPFKAYSYTIIKLERELVH